jgi:carbon storage regulator
MLVLSRYPGESLLIGDNVVVTILAVTGTQIRIGVTAPRSIPVHREEVYERIKERLADKL